MSESQLYILNKNLEIAEIIDFKNSWLFTPPIVNYLINKYAPEEDKQEAIRNQEKYGFSENFDRENPLNFLTYFSPFFRKDKGKNRFGYINDALNNSQILTDRIGWEITNQQMFRSSDKKIITDAILQLLKDTKGDKERFNEIKKAIEEIDQEKNPFFIFKNTTVDDGVERYFIDYDEKDGDIKRIGLKEYPKKLDFDLVIIENNTICFERPVKKDE